MPIEKPSTPCLELQNVSFRYNATNVLENLNFAAHVGDYIGVLGPNGSGKSTLLKIILGLLKPTQGKVKLFGREIVSAESLSLIGYVPQQGSELELQFPATVEEIVLSGRTVRTGLLRPFGKQDEQAAGESMKKVGVYGLRKKLIGELSGGQRQRVYIARALAAQPKMLILDEPTGGIDVAAENAFYKMLRDFNEKDNMTIIIVSHDIDVIAREVDSVLCLNRNFVCHLPRKEFNKEEYLQNIYGNEVKLIHHKH